jgi:hypothetical protein
MKQSGLVGFAVLFVLMSSGCSAEAVKRATYETLYQKQCMDRVGTPNCDRDRESYDEYKKEREEALNRDR